MGKKFTHRLIAEDISAHNYDISNFELEYNVEEQDVFLIFSQMVKMYVFENFAQKYYHKIKGFLHLGIGQESIYASLEYVLSKLNKRTSFLFIGSYRCHNLAYISGSSFLRIASEILGKKKGSNKGKGGSMHIENSRLFGGHGIVGAQCPLGTGLGFAIKYFQKYKEEIQAYEKNLILKNKISAVNQNGQCSCESAILSEQESSNINDSKTKKNTKEIKPSLVEPHNLESAKSILNSNQKEDSIANEFEDTNDIIKSNYPTDLLNKEAVFVFLGDGATNQGQLYESYNLAIVHELPVIFIIENNQKSMWTDTKDVTDTTEYYKRWYKMPAIRSNSDHVLVLSCIFEQVLRRGDFPIVIQIDTQRICAHSGRDEKDFNLENMRGWSQRTRMGEFEMFLQNAGFQKDVDFLWENIVSQIEECWKEADSGPLPDVNDLLNDIE